MDEKLKQKRLKKLMFILVLICAALISVGWILSNILTGIFNKEICHQLVEDAGKFRNGIDWKIETDIQILYTIAGFMEADNAYDMEKFADGLNEANYQNNFCQMGFFQCDGNGIRVSADSGTEENMRAESLEAPLYEVIQEAWEGRSAVSCVYYDSEQGERFVSCAVPVYQGEQVAGALATSKNVSVLFQYLQDMGAYHSHVNLYVVDDKGNWILPSDGEGLIKSNGEHEVPQLFIDPDQPVYEMKIFSGNTGEELKNAIKGRKSFCCSVKNGQQEYSVALEPTSLKNWNLLVVNKNQELRDSMYKNIALSRVVFLTVTVVVVIFLFWGYRALQRNDREFFQMAYTDALTGAPNLTSFSRKLESELEKGKNFSVLAINIRQFKFINEIFGDVTANTLLVDMKEVLEAAVGENEFFCRETADKFYMFMKTTDKEKIRERFSEIIEQVRQRFYRHHREYQIMMYAGVVTADEMGSNHLKREEIMTHVMFALNRARSRQAGEIWFYNAELHQSELLGNYIEAHMEQALKDGEFKLYLQPQNCFKTGRLGGAEALVRWITAEGEMIYPDQFIPLFEKNGFCSELDFYMVEQVCRQMCEWRDMGKEMIPVSVNQSKLVFYKEDYVERLCRIVEKYNILPEMLTLEILEGMSLENVKQLNERILEMKAKGFKISMDDFGSGYSSLNTLSSLDIDELKLDRVFLLKMSGEKKEKQQIIMKQIVEMAKKMDIITVAEGVETKEQEVFICEAGCDYGQGYYYSPPVSAQEFTEHILSDKNCLEEM